MAKPLKIVLAAVGVLLLLLVGAVVLAATFFDPNDYRGRITAEVKEKTGRDLTLGNIKLSVFPWLKVNVTDVSFSNAQGFGTTPMAQVGEADVGVQLMPLLLHKQVRVSTVTLAGLKLDLAKDAQGRTNWDDLVKPKGEKPDEPKKENEKSPLADIDIAGVTLKDADIVYRDAASNQSYRLSRVNLETGALRPGEDFDIDASLSLASYAPKASADVTLSANVLADLVAQKAKIGGLKFTIKGKGPGDEDIDAKLAADVAGDLATQVFHVDGLTLEFKGGMKDMSAEGTLKGKVAADLRQQIANVDDLKLQFKAAMKDLAADGTLTGKVKAGLSSKVYQVSSLALDAKASGGAIPGGKQSLKLTGDVTYDGAKGSMRFAGGRINAAGLDVTTSIVGEGLTTDSPRLSGPISIAPFNPRTLLAAVGQADIKTADPKVLTNASLSANYSGSFKSVKLDGLKLKLDDTTAAGSFAVNDLATQALAFALKVDRLDADRYLAPAPANKTPQLDKPPAEAKRSSDEINKTQLPTEAIEKINASGTLDVAELKLKGATLKDVRLKVDGPKGSPKIVRLDTQVFGGQVATSTTLTPGARPTYAVTTNVDAVSLSPMLQTLAGKDLVSGLGTIKLDLTTAGNTVGDVRRALNGNVALDFRNGAVKGFNLGQILRKSKAMLSGQPFDASEPKETDFTVIGFTAKIVNGVLKSDQLDALSPLFRVGGSGEVDLVNETLNYLAQPTIVNSAKGQGGKGLEDLAGITVPIRISGSFYDPKYKLDLQTALKQKAGDQLRATVADKVLGGDGSKPLSDQEFKQKANEKIGTSLSKGLDKLLGGKKKKSEAELAAPASEGAAPASTPPATEESKPAN